MPSQLQQLPANCSAKRFRNIARLTCQFYDLRIKKGELTTSSSVSPEEKEERCSKAFYPKGGRRCFTGESPGFLFYWLAPTTTGLSFLGIGYKVKKASSFLELFLVKIKSLKIQLV